MKKLVCGVMAHVDAGKTTLSEGILYTAGSIRTMGRVDNKDAYLDTFDLEKERGITIFSKQAVFTWQDTEVTLLDTPGHVDFSGEMERVLQVLDYAILVVSGSDGVQGHTETLWSLLRKNKIPTFLFINKMDQPGTDKEALLINLQERLGNGFVDFSIENGQEFYESVALSDEGALNEFLENEKISKETIQQLILERKVFPCFFGAALKLCGVKEFLDGLLNYVKIPVYGDRFGARVFKIARDKQGNRLTYLKVTGGILKTKELLTNGKNDENGAEKRNESNPLRQAEEIWKEKVNQIQIHSGAKVTVIQEAKAGTVCAVTGLTKTFPGQGFGMEADETRTMIEPVLTYQIVLPENCPANVALPKLQEIEEEEPLLHLVWNEQTQQIMVQIMGEIQTEILKRVVKERFDMDISFASSGIVYKETIKNTVEGVGHFEPLRHYAEVHLIMEPLEAGSGLVITSDCREDELDLNWQRLILTHLCERSHPGVLTGSPITDIKITLVAGRAHTKHTEGGDFRQATYRAVRQGLKQAESVLLEPYYEFRLEVPETMLGRAMTDMDRLCAKFETPEIKNGYGILEGKAPVATMQEYHKEVIAYSKGKGRLYCSFYGYLPCHNTEEVLEEFQYDSERDVENPTGSVFCSHGAGHVVSWDEVFSHMHIESVLSARESKANRHEATKEESGILDYWMGVEEIDKILERTFYANKKEEGHSKWAKKKAEVRSYGTISSSSEFKKARNTEAQKDYLLVDGYNIIYAWKEFKELVENNLEGARGKLQDILCNYQAFRKCELILVFDAYRVAGHQTEVMKYHNINVVFTKEAETADQYIEKFSHENGRKHKVTVATADGLEQIIIRSQGCFLMSASELREEVLRVNQQIREEYLGKDEKLQNYVIKRSEDYKKGEE